MKIKKFKAKNFSEALALVKSELSDDAVILSTRENNGLNPSVEVTAAIDYDNNIDYNNNEEIKKEAEGKQLSHTATEQGESIPPDGNYFLKMTEGIKNEMESLKYSIQDIKGISSDFPLPPEKRSMLYFLRERAVSEEFSLLLCEKANYINDIYSLLLSDIKVKGNTDGSKVIMFVGPTGVGKTTTMAKIASDAIKKGKKVAMINLDNYRIGAIEQLRIYSRILGIPLSNVSNTKELNNALTRHYGNKDIICIDTTGRNPKDESYINNLLDIISLDIPIELHLLMSANYDGRFMTKMYNFYKKLPVNFIAFTKIDEAVRFGLLYNLLMTTQKPIAYITTGQSVPDDIEFVNEDRIANLILKRECYNVN